MKIFKAEFKGVAAYVRADSLNEAVREFSQIMGPNSDVVWSEVDRLPEGEAFL